MTAQKRDFSSFANDDYLHFSTPSPPGFSSLHDAVDREQNIQWSSDGHWYPHGGAPELSSVLFPFEPTEDDSTILPTTEHAKDQSLWLDDDGLAQDPFLIYNSGSEPATQESNSSASSHVVETPVVPESQNVCYGMVSGTCVVCNYNRCGLPPCLSDPIQPTWRGNSPLLAVSTQSPCDKHMFNTGLGWQHPYFLRLHLPHETPRNTMINS